MKNSNMPAMPTIRQEFTGLNKLEHFTALAMQGLIEREAIRHGNPDEENTAIGERAAEIATATLRILEEQS